MSTGYFLTDIENASIAKILSALNQATPAKPIVNRCDVYRGEKDEVFTAIIRETAPAVWLFLRRAFNGAKEFENADMMGKTFSEGTTEDRLLLVWSFLVCAKSLRATKELSQGGPGVIGAYEILQLMIGTPQAMPGAPGPSPMQLRGWAPASYAEKFILVGWELLGQTTTAAVYELQLRTRVQL